MFLDLTASTSLELSAVPVGVRSLRAKLSSHFLFSPSFSDSPLCLLLALPLLTLVLPRVLRLGLHNFIHTKLCHSHISLPAPLVSVAPSRSYLLIHRPDCRAPEYIAQGNLPALGLQEESLCCQRRERFPKGSEPWALQG